MRVNQLGGRLDEAANNDKGIMAVGLILFWPVLFALGGTKQQEAEYSRLRGEYDALEQQATLRKCSRAAPVVTTAATPTAVVAAATPEVVPVIAHAPTTSTQPIPVAVRNATTAAMAGSVVSTPIVPPAESKFLFNAERYAKGAGCVMPVATRNIWTATSETFTATCSSGEAMSIRCDPDCRELK